MNEAVVVLFTGVSNSGKTRLMSLFSKRLTREGISVGVVNDYPFFQEWKAMPEHSRFKVDLDDTFDLLPGAYRSISAYAANRILEESRLFFEEDKQVVLAEGARGAFGEDDYVEGLYLPIARGLERQFGDVSFANIEVVAPSIEVLLERARERLHRDSTSPPVEVVYKYVDDEGVPLRSSVAELRQYGLVFNEQVVNGVSKEQLGELVEGVYPRLVERLGWRITPEGTRRNKGVESL